MDPPPCVQNAMMTKDKKPFTYTPGGIDLSEVRSPRMQRRIERNATLGGASDMPQQPPRPQNVGPLPPAALAAMRPQPQVQVFPSPPPPPPIQKHIPPPPPPPSGPMPTQKVTTGDNQVLERPDMTKIIPDNPMALLRRTGGPAPRKSFVDQMYEGENKTPPSPPQRAYEAQSPRYQPPVVERSAPVSPPVQQQRQPQQYQPPPQQYQPPTPPQNQYQPPSPPQNQYQPPQQSYQPAQPPQPHYQPGQVQPRPAQNYQPPIIERQPSLEKQTRPQKTISSSVGSLYIPPLNQQQQPAQQQKFASPPTPPDHDQQVQSPGTPTLKEAPKPWQQKSVQQQQEIPPWAKKDNEERVQTSPQAAPNQRWQQPVKVAPAQQPAPQQVRQPPGQQFSPRSPLAQQPPPSQNQSYPSNSFPVHIEIRTGPYAQDPEPTERKPEAVYVTQPIVLQHPGQGIAPPYKGQPKPQQQPQQPSQNSYQQPRQQLQQQPKVDSSGARIIPIQIERTPPSTPGADRGLSRQLSWGTQPPQSNSFKVIQKFTRTDDDEDDDTPLTQHSPRYPQEMPEQVRRMKIHDNGHFKQDVQIYDEENPRYRGGYIPSRIFKLLDESVPSENNIVRTEPKNQRKGNGQPQQYVHPSEQVVPEPKKYMGSNIPSRSFKILQAMTAPSDSCANADYKEELPYNPVYNPYNYPYYPPPFWPDYYPNCYPPEQSELTKPNDKLLAKSGNGSLNAGQYTPPHWHDYYSNFYPQQQSDSSSRLSDKSSSTKSGRSTPLPTAVPIPHPMPPPPFWGYMPPNISTNEYVKPRGNVKSENTLRPQTPKPTEGQSTFIDEAVQYPPYHMYPPYFDPYYYAYYYGYPPVIPPFPFYSSSTENEEYSGYSSQDEMSSYNSRRSSLKRRNSLEDGSPNVQALRQQFEIRSKSATPRITVTPSYSEEKLSFKILSEKEKGNKNVEIINREEERQTDSKLCRLQSIRSVQDIHVYASEECSEAESADTEESEEETEEEEEIIEEQDGEEVIPHQLSIIYEESERGDSRRSFRPSSVASESSTIAEHRSEEEDFEDFLAAQNIKYKINMFQEISEQLTEKSSGGKTEKIFEQGSKSLNSFCKESVDSHTKERSVYQERNDHRRCFVEKYETKNEMLQGKVGDDKDIMQYDEKNKHKLFVENGKTNKNPSREKVLEEKPVYQKEKEYMEEYKSNHRVFQDKIYSDKIIADNTKYDKRHKNELLVENEKSNKYLTSDKVQDKNSVIQKKNNHSRSFVEEYKSSDRIFQDKTYNNENITNNSECEKENKKILFRENEKPNQYPTNEKVMQNKTNELNNGTDKESDEDWWDIIKNDDESPTAGRNKKDSIKNEEKECDKINPKAENVMTSEEETEVVCVKLRNKGGPKRNSDNRKGNFVSNVTEDKILETQSAYNRSSIYDILKDDNETDEIVSGGTLMRVGSFVSALEAIKRNSGLWNLEDTNFGNPPIIKEEVLDNEDSETTYNGNDENKLSDKPDTNNIDYNKCDENTDLKEEAANDSEESEIDFWSQIKGDEDDFVPRRRSTYYEEKEEIDTIDTSLPTEAQEADSASSRHSSFSKSHEVTKAEVESEANIFIECSQEKSYIQNQYCNQSYQEDTEDSEETSDSESSDEEQGNEKINSKEESKRNTNSRSRSLEPQTIKERIEALRKRIAEKQRTQEEKEEISVSVKSKISAIEIPVESRSKTTSTKSSVRSFEDYSEEEEGDSGVISDISRHISDSEEFPELRKLTRYERAATHSRLFKLLQEECDIEEEEDEVFVQPEDKFSRLSVRQSKSGNRLTPSRSKLSLSLNKCNENSTGPQVNEKLVDELVQSLLRSRKAQVFRDMPREKLRAAAILILQEGIDGCETPSEEFSSLLSPLRGDTESSTPAQTPQEFYGDNGEYRQYYESWSDAAELRPSKAFRLLQEHFGTNKLGTIEGILAKCPRILSNKNISKEILKHLDELSSDCSLSHSQNPPQSNDVTNT